MRFRQPKRWTSGPHNLSSVLSIAVIASPMKRRDDGQYIARKNFSNMDYMPIRGIRRPHGPRTKRADPAAHRDRSLHRAQPFLGDQWRQACRITSRLGSHRTCIRPISARSPTRAPKSSGHHVALDWPAISKGRSAIESVLPQYEPALRGSAQSAPARTSRWELPASP